MPGCHPKQIATVFDDEMSRRKLTCAQIPESCQETRAKKDKEREGKEKEKSKKKKKMKEW